jgi:hypothetical protein
MLTILVLALVPTAAFGQGEESCPPPEVTLPLPFGGDNFRHGQGLFTYGEFMFIRQSNPMQDQGVAVRGFLDVDGTASGTGIPGTFVGSKFQALSTGQVAGPVSWQPGMELGIGWRFQDGTTIEVNWMHLTDAKYAATASILPRNFILGPSDAETFLFSPVFNFPPNYAGPADVLAVGNPGSTFGIWNAATVETILFTQRFEMVTTNLKIPIETGQECFRMYGLVGTRAIVLWERFYWRTVKADVNGIETPIWTANYANIVSNRLYGPMAGCAYDWYLGSSPLGAFFISGDLQGALFIDIVKERARYELADRSTAASRSRGDYQFVPMIQGDLAINWIPYEGIQARIGWNLMGLFNTVASRHPIDFDFGAIAPPYSNGVTRWFNGLHVGVAFIF